ncbi:adenosylcobinamide-GDP ribazoletransferase [Nitrospira sp. Kam-Ns4a]
MKSSGETDSNAAPLTPYPFRSFVIAWQFLTAIPLSHRHHDPTPQELACSMGWYPVVGLLLGAGLAAGDWLLSAVLARGVVDALLILLLVGLTRGLHQDGLADALDGLAGGRTPEERLAIMRDGRIGAIGATGLVLALGLRYAGLAALPPLDRLPALVCMPAVGRLAMVVGAASASYARAEGGLAAPFLGHLSWRAVLAGTLVLGVALLWLAGPVGALGGLAVAALAGKAQAVFWTRACGGVTGDTLGATNEVAEILFLLAAPMLLGWR